MAVPKILLYYAFAPLPDPEAIRLWQRDLCRSLNLTGRIIVSPQGINGTVGGELANVKRYLRSTREYPAFKHLDVKWSEGTGNDFPKLSVKVRDEIVAFGAPEQVEVDANGVVGGGTRLSPEELHELVERDDEVVFFDGRNAIEAEIGRFAGAVVPPVEHTRDFLAELDSGRYDHLKSKPVVTYCTGGVRCEVLSSLLRQRGFEQVYQLDGGIVRYGERFGDSGLWQGSLYVFDGRRRLTFSDAARVISSCAGCGLPSADVQNCADAGCRTEFVRCSACVTAGRAEHCPAHASDAALAKPSPR